jgi:hypothetical protein
VTTDLKIDGAFFGQVFHLDKFKGIEPGKWIVDWKAELNRTVVLMVGMTPKADKNAEFDLDAALARLGYLKVDAVVALRDLIAAAPDLLAACQAARIALNRSDNDETLGMLAAAIAKATGEEATIV